MSTATPEELSLWLSWKRISEASRGRILAEVIAHSPLNESELTVLAHLDEADGTLRQNALAAAAGWDRTRLSHLLTRMQERGYVARKRLSNGVEVSMLAAGEKALRSTGEPLARAVHRHFASRLSAEHQRALREVIDALSDTADARD